MKNNYEQFEDFVFDVGGFPLMSLPKPARYILGGILVFTALFFAIPSGISAIFERHHKRGGK